MSNSTTMMHDVKSIRIMRASLSEKGKNGEERFGIDIYINTVDGLAEIFTFPAQDRLEVYFNDQRIGVTT